MNAIRLLVCLGAAALLAPPALAQQTAFDFYNAAEAAMKKADFDTAITAFSQSIARDPGSMRVLALNGRGFARFHKGDLEGATSDFAAVLAIEPKWGNAYYGRALAEQAKGTLDEAIADYEETIALDTTPSTSDNPHFYLWVVRVQQNQKADADKELAAYLATRPPVRKNDWSAKLGAFLLGQVSETDLNIFALAYTTIPAQERAQCEAWYFAGMKRLISGDKAAAADDFQKCLGTNQTILTQYPLAKAAAQAIELNPPE